MNSTRLTLQRRLLLQAATHKSERIRSSTLCNTHHLYKATTILIDKNQFSKKQQQCHHFSSLSPLKRPPCPFKTLNIPKESKYSHAKKSFLKIAMKHHPDTVGNDCQETQQKSQIIFMKCRRHLNHSKNAPILG